MSVLLIEDKIPRDDVIATFGDYGDLRTVSPRAWEGWVKDFSSFYGTTYRETVAYVHKVLKARDQ